MIIKVKQLSGELSKYSGWGGKMLDIQKGSTGNHMCRVVIAAPPLFDDKPIDIWLASEMLVTLKETNH